MSATPRLALPYILVNQSQKEVTHNEALNQLDAMVHLAVESADLAAPPADPADGSVWIVAAPATDAWTGFEGHLAQWIGAAWHLLPPPPGARAWIADRGVDGRFDGVGWRIGVIEADALEIGGQQVVAARQPAIAEPTDGSTIDAEARSAIGAILGALRAHGLIAP